MKNPLIFCAKYPIIKSTDKKGVPIVARTTIRQIINKGFEVKTQWWNEINPQLQAAYEAGKITAGELYYVYAMNADYHYKRFQVLLDRVAKSKTRVPSDIATKLEWNYLVEKLVAFNAKCLARLAEEG